MEQVRIEEDLSGNPGLKLEVAFYIILFHTKLCWQVRTLADPKWNPFKEMSSTEEKDLEEVIEMFTVGKVLGRFEEEKNRETREAGGVEQYSKRSRPFECRTRWMGCMYF